MKPLRTAAIAGLALLGATLAAAEDRAGWSARAVLSLRSAEPTAVVRAGQTLLLRVGWPAPENPGASNANNAIRVGVRQFDESLGEPVGPEFLAEPDNTTGDRLSGLVSAILPMATRRVQLTLYGDRQRPFDAGTVTLSPTLRELPRERRLMVLVSDRPSELEEKLRSAGLVPPSGWELATLAPEDLPDNLAGLESADAVALDAATYLRSGRRQEAIRRWGLRRAERATLETWGAPVVLLDPAGAIVGREKEHWSRNPRVGPETPLWVPSASAVGFADRGGLPMGLPADGAVIPGPSWENRPTLAEPERQALLIGIGGFAVSVLLVGLFFGGEGRAGIGLGGLTVCSAAALGVVFWQMPTRPTARLDVWQIIEVRPTAPALTARVPWRSVTGLTVAGLRSAEVTFSTRRLVEPVHPVCPTTELRRRAPIQLELVRDGDTQLTVTPTVATERLGSGAATSASGPELPRWRRQIPIWSCFAVGEGRATLPLRVAVVDGRQFRVTTGAGWEWKLTDCVLIDVRDPAGVGSGSLASRLDDSRLGERARLLAKLSDARVVALGELSAGQSADADLYGGRAMPFAEYVTVADGEDQLSRFRKSVLRLAVAGDGWVGLDAPYLAGWAAWDESPIAASPTRVRTNEVGRLVLIRLDGVLAD